MIKKQQWKDKGYKGTRFNAATPFLNSGHEHFVTNAETGEQRTIQVNSDQTLAQAIETGEQWIQNEEEKNSLNETEYTCAER
jgi:hypothetical protein